MSKKRKSRKDRFGVTPWPALEWSEDSLVWADDPSEYPFKKLFGLLDSLQRSEANRLVHDLNYLRQRWFSDRFGDGALLFIENRWWPTAYTRKDRTTVPLTEVFDDYFKYIRTAVTPGGDLVLFCYEGLPVGSFKFRRNDEQFLNV